MFPEKENKLHANFSICIDCTPCGGNCSFLQNSVMFVKDSMRMRVTNLHFDSSQSVCDGACGKKCINNFKLTSILRRRL